MLSLVSSITFAPADLVQYVATAEYDLQVIPIGEVPPGDSFRQDTTKAPVPAARPASEFVYDLVAGPATAEAAVLYRSKTLWKYVCVMYDK